MVAHNNTDPPLLRALMRWHRTFFEENSSIMFSRRNPGGAMSRDGNLDRLDVDQTKDFAWDGEGTMHAHFPTTI